MTDMKLQEMVFLGSIYLSPDLMYEYHPILRDVHAFQTEPARSVWKGTSQYYTKYHSIPQDNDVLESIFDEDQIEALSTAMEIVCSNNDRSAFLLDSFRENLKLTLLRRLHMEMDMYLDEDMPDISSAMEKINAALSAINSTMSSNSDASLMTSTEILNSWKREEFDIQKGLIPLGIAGIEDYYQGVPYGQLNYVIAAYGAGKTTIMSQFGMHFTNLGPTLYVTLEMPSVNILFKMLSTKTDKLDPAYAFSRMNDLDPDVVSTADSIDSKLKNPLYIYDVPANSIKSSMVGAMIEKIRLQDNVNIKHVIVDYGDLMNSEEGGMKDLGWIYMQRVAEDLSGMAKRYKCNVWTVSQTGKETTDQNDPTKFRPIRARDLWGSTGKGMTGCLILGWAMMKVPEKPWLAVGVLSNIKNRFGSFSGDLICKMDFRRSKLQVIRPIPSGMNASDAVRETMVELQNNDSMSNAMTDAKKRTAQEVNKRNSRSKDDEYEDSTEI